VVRKPRVSAMVTNIIGGGGWERQGGGTPGVYGAREERAGSRSSKRAGTLREMQNTNFCHLINA